MGKFLEWTGGQFLAAMERWALASGVMQHLYFLKRMSARVDPDSQVMEREKNIFRILDETIEMARYVLV